MSDYTKLKKLNFIDNVAAKGWIKKHTVTKNRPNLYDDPVYLGFFE